MIITALMYLEESVFLIKSCFVKIFSLIRILTQPPPIATYITGPLSTTINAERVLSGTDVVGIVAVVVVVVVGRLMSSKRV